MKIAVFLVVSLFSVSIWSYTPAQAPDYRGATQVPGANYYDIKKNTDDWLVNQNSTSLANSQFSINSYNRWKWMWDNRVTGPNHPPGSFEHVGDATLEMFQNNIACSVSDPSNWTQMGIQNFPSQNLGIVTAIKVDPNDASLNTIYIGTPASGIWKTSNANVQNPDWHCLSSGIGVPAMGVQSIEIVYLTGGIRRIVIATGMTTQANFYGYTLGILYSDDDGITWTNASLSQVLPSSTEVFLKVMADRLNPNIIYAMSNTTIYKSYDGGLTYDRKQFTYTPSLKYGGASSLADINQHPTDPNIIYLATTGKENFNTTSQVYSGHASVFMTIDAFEAGGANDRDITPPECQNFCNQAQRIAVAVSLSTPDNLYAISFIPDMLEDDGPPFNAHCTQQYTHKGTWDPFTSTFVWDPAVYIPVLFGDFYKMELEISPTTANEWFVGGLDNQISTDGGSTFTDIPNLHVDIRELVIYQDQSGGPNIIFAGTDGGISKKIGSDNWRNLNGNGLDITQFFGIDVSQSISDFPVFGGSQDNSALYKFKNKWYRDIGGDCYDAVIDKDDPFNVWVAINDDYLAKALNLNIINEPYDYTNSCNTPPCPIYGNAPFFSRPMLQHNTNGYFYMGVHNLYRTQMNGSFPFNWQKMSDMQNQFSSNPCLPDNSIIKAFDVAPSDENYIYIAYGYGYPTGATCPHTMKLFRNKLANSSISGWEDLTPNLVESTTGYRPTDFYGIKDILINPTNRDEVWIVFDGFSGNPGENKVYHGIYNGTTYIWNDYSQGLEVYPVSSIIYQKGSNGLLYLATDAGVYYRDASMSAWDCFKKNLPPCIVSDLEIDYCSSKIRAATFGRGIWESNLAVPISSIHPATPVFTSVSASVCPLPFVAAVTNMSGVQYYWTITQSNSMIFVPGSSNSISLIGFTPPLILSEDATITVTAVNTTSGCGTSNSITVPHCCTGDESWTNIGSYYILNVNVSQFKTTCGAVPCINTNYNQANPKSMSFNGTFTVNTDLNLDHCEWIMGANARIYINSGKTLTIRNSLIHACTVNWDGIYLADYTSKLIIENSIIEYSDNGIYTYNGGELLITNSIFDNNKTSITLRNGDFTLSEFYGNSFDYTSLPFFDEKLPGTHIQIDNSTNVSFGSSLHFLNRLSRAYNGIRTSYSQVNISNNEFSKIGILEKEQPSVYVRYGNAIYAAGGDNQHLLRVGGMNPQEGNSFIDTHNGISVDNRYNTAIENNYFEAESLAISIIRCQGMNHVVNNNVILYSDRGINFYDDVDANIEVSYNNFNVSKQGKYLLFSPEQEGYKAINIQNPFGASVNLNCAFNLLNNVQYGIHLRNIANINSIYGNVFRCRETLDYLLHHSPVKGIWLENCEMGQIKQNLISWDEIPTVDALSSISGIALSNTIGYDVQENNLNDIGAGIKFSGICTSTRLLCNNLIECYHGVYADPAGLNTQISDQGDWTGTTSTSSSWNNYWHDNIDYKVAGDQMITLPLWLYDSSKPTDFWTSPHAPNVLFDQDATLPYQGCDPDRTIGAMERNKDYGAAITDTINYEYDELEYKYSAKQAFFMAAQKDLGLLDLNVPSDVLYQNKYNQYINENVGKFADIGVEVKNGNISEALQKLYVLDDLNLQECNKKYLLTKYLELGTVNMANDLELSSQVHSIADQHPFYGGDAVYFSRAILNLDVEDHLPALRRTKTNKEKSIPTNNDLFVVPNPAKDKCTIVLKNEVQSPSKLIIYNSLNTVVFSKQLPLKSKYIEIDLNSIIPGVYQCTIFNADQMISSRLVVVK